MDTVLAFFGMGPPPKLADIIREKRNELSDARWDIDFECEQMDRDEKKLETKIRGRAKAGKMREVRALAKRVVQFQRMRERLIMVQARLQEVETSLATVQTQKQLTEALTLGVRVMQAVRIGAPGHASLRKVMENFDKEQTYAQGMEEMMDGTTGLDDDEGDENELVDAVLAKLDIETADELDGLHVVVGSSSSAGGRAMNAEDRAIEARLARLTQPQSNLSSGGHGNGT